MPVWLLILSQVPVFKEKERKKKKKGKDDEIKMKHEKNNIKMFRQDSPAVPENDTKACTQMSFSDNRGICERGRQKGVSLTCSRKQIGTNRKKTTQFRTNRGIREFPENKERKLEQIGRKRGNRNKSG